MKPTSNSLMQFLQSLKQEEIQTNETDEEIATRIREQFDVLKTMTKLAIDKSVAGSPLSLIVRGKPGLGKTFTIEKILNEWKEECASIDPNHQVVAISKGHIRSTGLYRLLWDFRHPGCILMFDDADSMFYEEVSLNLLKAALDTTEKRVVSWLTEAQLLAADGDIIPRSFEFEASLIFVSNLDFIQRANAGDKLSKHFEAFLSRCHYLDIGINTLRECLIRIHQVVNEEGMLSELSDEDKQSVFDYLDEAKERLRELSLRTAVKVADMLPVQDWKKIANKTLCHKS